MGDQPQESSQEWAPAQANGQTPAPTEPAASAAAAQSSENAISAAAQVDEVDGTLPTGADGAVDEEVVMQGESARPGKRVKVAGKSSRNMASQLRPLAGLGPLQAHVSPVAAQPAAQPSNGKGGGGSRARARPKGALLPPENQSAESDHQDGGP